jgi:serine/threonine protein kinase
MSDAVIGTEVDGYRIQSVLGRGGMGTVYKAEDVNLSRTVAIKRINPGQQERESFIHRFRSEAQALARIDSTYIVGVYALRETDIGLLIVMEYVEGGTLKDPLDRQGALAPAQAVPILEQTLQAFEDAHSAGVIHRDIKPENVMLTQDGVVKVTDFGIAKLRQPDSGETVTQGGQGGTLKYMSPEQISSIDDVDARSDVYSLGMTAYEILAGALPFTDTDTDFDIMRKVVEGKIPPPDELNPDLPSGLAQWIVGAIQKEQDDRYQSAGEMKDALHRATQQTNEKTVTQPSWEVEGGSADADETQTVVPGESDRTQTVVPEDEESEGEESDPTSRTVMGPGTAMEGATQPTVPDPPDEKTPPAQEASPNAEEADEPEEPVETETNWAVAAGAGAVLLLLIGGYLVFAQLGGSAGGEATATLSLTTAPEGALVVVNGDTAGTTPVTGYAVGAGPVALKVRRDGFVPIDTTLTAAAGGRVELQRVALTATSPGEPASGTPTADSKDESSENRPERADDRAPTGPDPTADASTTGDETDAETASPSSSQATSEETETTAAEQTSTTAENPSTGRVRVTPRPSGTVLVDGEERSSGTITLPAGQHTVSCRHPSYGSVQTTVTVSEGQTEPLTCYFQREVSVTTRGAFGRIWLNGRNTGKNTNASKPLTLPPGDHRIEVRRKSLDSFRVQGGDVKIERGGDSQYESFSGQAYQIEVDPSFTEVEYAISFKVES